jgi:O-antigen/teichoic acid export membrane protein
MSLFRQSAVTFLTRITITLVNIPISMIVARVLGAEGQGIYSAAITFPNLWAGFGLLGLDAAHLYFTARDRRRLGAVLANSVVIVLLSVVILLPSYVLLLQPLVGEAGRALRPYLLLSALVVPLIVARHLALSLFLALEKVERYNLLLLLSQLGLLVLVALGLLAADRGTRFVVVAYQASLLLFLVPSIFWLRGVLKAEDRAALRVSRALFRESLSYGLKGHLGAVLTQFSYRFDTVLVLRWLGVAAQGYYSIAVLLAEKLSHITASVQFVLFPRISAAGPEEADRITPQVCRATLVAVTAAGLFMFAAGKLLLRLFYGRAYDPSLAPYYLLLPGIVTLALSNVLTSDLSGRNRRVHVTVAMAFGFAVNLALNFLWIRRHGIAGAALASTVSYTAQSAVMAVFFWRITGIPPHRLVIPERGDWGLYRGVAGRILGRVVRR